LLGVESSDILFINPENKKRRRKKESENKGEINVFDVVGSKIPQRNQKGRKT